MYSFGVSDETRFEGEMLDRTECEVFAYDASVRKLGPGMYHFLQVWAVVFIGPIHWMN